MPQRRARRCSLRAAVARLAISSRSHCGLFSVILESHEVDRAVALLEPELDQRRAVARAAQAPPACRFVGGAVSRAYQIASVGIEKYTLLPVEFHRNMGAAVEITMHATAMAYREGGRRLAEVLNLEAHTLARVGQG